MDVNPQCLCSDSCTCCCPHVRFWHVVVSVQTLNVYPLLWADCTQLRGECTIIFQGSARRTGLIAHLCIWMSPKVHDKKTTFFSSRMFSLSRHSYPLEIQGEIETVLSVSFYIVRVEIYDVIPNFPSIAPIIVVLCYYVMSLIKRYYQPSSLSLLHVSPIRFNLPKQVWIWRPWSSNFTQFSMDILIH